MDATRTAYGAVQDKKDTFFSNLSGLPGYKPPFPIRIGYYLSFTGVILGFLGFTLSLGWVGVELLFGRSTVLRAAQVGELQLLLTLPLVGLGASLLALVGFGTLLRIVDRASIPFEEEYENWVETVVPENHKKKYPPQEYWEAISETEIEEPPAYGPRELREDTLSEKMIDKLSTVLSLILTMQFYQLFYLVNSPPVESEKEKREKRNERKSRYQR